jgi:hypothetical protein
MADVVQGSTLYAGSVSEATIYKILAGNGFQWGDHVRFEPMVDAKPRQLTRGEDSGTALIANVSKPRQSDFDGSTWATTIDGRQLNVTPVIALKQIDNREWLTTFKRFQPSGTSIDLQVNTEIRDITIDLSLNKIHTEINALNSSGTAGAAAWDGFTTLINADGDATQVGTPAVLTSANIISYMFDLRDAVDPRLRSNPNLKIFCSYADADLFDRAARGTQDAQVTATLDGVRSITQANGGSVPVVPIEGIPKDFVFITVAGTGDDSNLVQGFWMEEDMTALSLYKEQPADEVWNLVFRASFGVNYYTGKDIWYLDNI